MCAKYVMSKPLSAKIAIVGWGGALLIWVIVMVVEIIKAI